MLIERDGVLAGLNLREVADEAGVNRGLVYHYFGSRRDLLRAALRADVRERMREVRQGDALPLRQRYVRFFRTMLRHRRALVLAALLVLDGDKAVRLVPDVEGRRTRFRSDVERGHISADVDDEGFYAARVSLVYGYAIFRTRLAEELGVDVADLDDRVIAVQERMIAGLQPAPPTDGSDAGPRRGPEPPSQLPHPTV